MNAYGILFEALLFVTNSFVFCFPKPTIIPTLHTMLAAISTNHISKNLYLPFNFFWAEFWNCFGGIIWLSVICNFFICNFVIHNFCLFRLEKFVV